MIDTAIAVLSGLRNSLDSAVSTLDEQKVLIDEKLRPYWLPVGEVVALGSDDEIEELILKLFRFRFYLKRCFVREFILT
jgi:hypothetical protein